EKVHLDSLARGDALVREQLAVNVARVLSAFLPELDEQRGPMSDRGQRAQQGGPPAESPRRDVLAQEDGRATTRIDRRRRVRLGLPFEIAGHDRWVGHQERLARAL